MWEPGLSWSHKLCHLRGLGSSGSSHRTAKGALKTRAVDAGRLSGQRQPDRTQEKQEEGGGVKGHKKVLPAHFRC